MSRYSGKCDFGDTWRIHGEEHILNSDIYIGNNIVPLRINTYKDALPYFPHLVWLMAYDKESNKSVIRLSDKSFVDSEERERLGRMLDDMKREYRRCKRKRIPFLFDNLRFTYMEEIYGKIFYEVEAKGEKAKIPYNLHFPYHDMERVNLYEDMVKAGYAELKAAIWCFGYERCIYDDLPESVKGVMQRDSS